MLGRQIYPVKVNTRWLPRFNLLGGRVMITDLIVEHGPWVTFAGLFAGLLIYVIRKSEITITYPRKDGGKS